MIRKIILFVAAASVATTASAHDRYNDYRQYNSLPPYLQHREYRYRDRTRDSDVVPILLGGILLGAILNQQPAREPPRPRQYFYDPDCDCYRR